MIRQIKFLFCGIMVPLLFTQCLKKDTAVPGLGKEYAPNFSKTISYLALGDSYTIGQSVSQNESFPYQLKGRLKTYGVEVSDLQVLAKTGWTTASLKSSIDNGNVKAMFDIVTLLIGVNNQYQGLNKGTYRTEFIELVNRAIYFAKGDKSKVFVVSIPDWCVTPFAVGNPLWDISKDIDEFNRINKEEALKMGVSYTDITPISRQAATDPLLTCPDLLHPSAKMYKLWVNELLPKVLGNL